MKRAFVAALGLTGILVGASVRAAPVVTDPDWDRGPSADAIASVIPPDLARKGISGSAKIRCVVTVDGTLDQCAVVEESPPDSGYGAAALRASKLFHMRPRLVGGVRTGGAIVTVPIRFNLPGQEPPTPIVKPDWRLRPDWDDLVRLYPPEALRAGVVGKVKLRCVVSVIGVLEQCAVLSESPPEYGFGASALAMTRYFAWRPQTVNGVPVGGVPVDIPVDFGMSSGEYGAVVVIPGNFEASRRR